MWLFSEGDFQVLVSWRYTKDSAELSMWAGRQNPPRFFWDKVCLQMTFLNDVKVDQCGLRDHRKLKLNSVFASQGHILQSRPQIYCPKNKSEIPLLWTPRETICRLPSLWLVANLRSLKALRAASRWVQDRGDVFLRFGVERNQVHAVVLRLY